MQLKKTDYRGVEKTVDVPVFKWVAITLSCFVLIFLILISSSFGCREYNRYQKRADANNKAKIVNINIKRAKQEANVRLAQVDITKAEAKQRIAEAEGIRKSQDLISRTLTPLYVQHEAIKAQERLANSPNNTMVYIPSGPQGIPLVKNTP